MTQTPANAMDRARSDRSTPIAGRIRPASMVAMGVCVLLLFVIVGIARVMDRAPADGFSVNDVAELGLWAAVGVTAAALLVGVSILLALARDLRSLLARLDGLESASRPMAHSHGESSSATALGDLGGTKPPGDSAAVQEMLLLLRDIRDNSLLSEQERRDKAVRVADDEITGARAAIEELIAHNDFVQAKALAERIQGKHPDDDRAVDLAEIVERKRESRQAVDIRESAKQIDDLINISSWARARETAEQLRQRHLEAAEPPRLLERVEREFQAFQAEQRKRMYAEIQRYVGGKRWREALAAAETFIERFTHCQEAEMLRMQIPTLEANAEIGVRQELEAEIMDLAKCGRYIEAAELARKVIQQYPDSPQAEILRGLLPRLEQLANDPDAPPARVRVV